MKTPAAIAATAISLFACPPVSAAVTVIGTNPARSCYRAALEKAQGVRALPECDLALAGGGALGRYETVATHVNRGILRMYAGNLAGAIADYDAAIAIDAGQAEAWLNKGIALMRTGAAPGEPLRMLDTAIARKTREPALAHYARALVHEDAGNARAAYADFVRARDLSPKWKAPVQELKRFQVRRAGGGGGAFSR